MADLKVTPEHLRRDAYLYVRQSTLRQVAENIESTQRQYALRDRAVAAGWPAERIHVIETLAVQRELESRAAEVDTIRRQHWGRG